MPNLINNNQSLNNGQSSAGGGVEVLNFVIVLRRLLV